MRLRHFSLNTRGQDYAVGDIHGCYTQLDAALARIHFNPEVDRLFCVGDLVDRGSESEQALIWLARPWFFAVRGNHEEMAITWARGNPIVFADNYRHNGGGWFMDMAVPRQTAIAAILDTLPVAIEIETEKGLVGIVHADCPAREWQRFTDTLTSNDVLKRKSFEEDAMWDRRRYTYGETTPVEGLRAVVVGHCPTEDVRVLGNVYFIDTASWRQKNQPEKKGEFTLLRLSDLSVA